MKRLTRGLILSLLVLAMVSIMSIAVWAEEEMFVIGGQFAFSGEGRHVIEQMQKEGGKYYTIEGRQGRIFHVLEFKNFPGVRLIYTGTMVGMENATSSSEQLAEMGVDVDILSGISGNLGQGKIGDPYINDWWVVANYGTMHPWGFEHRPLTTWNPKRGEFFDIMYFKADPRLQILARIAFRKYKETETFKNIVAEMGREDDPPEIIFGGIGLSSDYFVASTQLNREWALQIYPIHPTTDNPKSYSVATVDMETAAAAKVCFERDIPFAGVRLPSDDARDEARTEISIWWKYAADFGGGFTWQWIQEIARYKHLFMEE